MNRKIETALYILGGILSIAVLAAFIAWRAGYTPPEPERETITVTSKEKRDDGLYCYGSEYYKSCKPRFKYFINNQETSEKVFSSVEEGKTYNCEKSAFGGWNKCEENKYEIED